MDYSEVFQEYKEKCIDLFGLQDDKEFTKVKLVLNNRMRTTIGRVYYKTGELHLNKRLLDDNPSEIVNTIVHELAHFVDFYKYGNHGHGKTWARIMKILGLKPTRCHSLDVSKYKREQKPVAYAKCECRRNIKIKKRRYQKIVKGTNYRCRRCKSILQLV